MNEDELTPMDRMMLSILRARIMSYRLGKATDDLAEKVNERRRLWETWERKTFMANLFKRTSDNLKMGLIRPEDLK